MPKLTPVSLGIFQVQLMARPFSLRLSPLLTERAVGSNSRVGMTNQPTSSPQQLLRSGYPGSAVSRPDRNGTVVLLRAPQRPRLFPHRRKRDAASMAGLRPSLPVNQIPREVPSTINPTATSKRDPRATSVPAQWDESSKLGEFRGLDKRHQGRRLLRQIRWKRSNRQD